MYAVKFREKGKKAFWFLTSNGGGNRLRIHAGRFQTFLAAASLVHETTSDPENSTFELKIIRFPYFPTTKS